MTDTKKPAAREKTSKGFSETERAAIRERAKELKAESRGRTKSGKADGEREVLSKIAEMPEPDRSMATKIHEIVKASAPALSPKTWYGMPAYANKDGKVVCFFTAAAKFNSRYATFGFNDDANLDEGNMWPASFALRLLLFDALLQRGFFLGCQPLGCLLRGLPGGAFRWVHENLLSLNFRCTVSFYRSILTSNGKRAK